MTDRFWHGLGRVLAITNRHSWLLSDVQSVKRAHQL